MNRKEFFIEASWGRIAVVTYNKEDLPLVILCHGRQDSADSFLPLIELLPPTYHYVTFDLPGCGYSDKFPLGMALISFTFVPALNMVADHYGDRKFIFFGHSGGGEIGVLYNALTEGKRISKFVDIDFLTVVPHVIPYRKQSSGKRLSSGMAMEFKDWLRRYYIDFFKPDNYLKLNGTLETAPSYSMEQALKLMQEARHLSPRCTEIALRRNIRPDPKNPGKYKFAWDQRIKAFTRTPVGADFFIKIREGYPLATLALITSYTKNFVRNSVEPDLPETLQQICPYFKMVEFDSYHDLHLVIPEKLVPHIVEFMELDLSIAKPKGLSKI